MSQTFQTLGVSAPLVHALAQHKFHSPFAVQELVLPDALAGLDVLAESPTGSGKTLAFGIPLVERTSTGGNRPSALVLVPTRELATQVADDLKPLAKAKKLIVAAVYGGTSVSGQARQARSAHILIATPGRLNDLLERRLISLENVKVLVLDEADRMLDMGFKPQVNRILSRVPRTRQTMLFSATLDGAVAELARDYTTNASRFRAELPKERAKGEIDHRFQKVTAEGKLDSLVEHLNGAERGLALVFVRTKHGADKLVKKLGRLDVAAAAMHGNMSQNQRERSLARFESGKVTTLVATDVAARGLDIDDITHVINFDPPHGDDDYVHRVGRTGRAGRSGTAHTFVLPEQQGDVGKLAGRLGHGDQFAEAGLRVPAAAASRPKQRQRQRQRGR